MKFQCDDCAKIGNIEDMVLKMGGLLCPSCRVIIFYPYINKEYFEEVNRRKKEGKEERKEDNESD